MRRLPLIALAAVLATAPAVADPLARQPRGLYADLQLGASGVSHSGLDFVSPLASVAVGGFLLPGVGVELFADASIGRGADERFEAGIERAVGVAARLQSPPVGRLEGYVTLGYVDLTLVQERRDGGDEIEERFGGLRIGVGLMQRLRSVPTLSVGAEYRNFRVDESLLLDGLVLGLRASFR